MDDRVKSMFSYTDCVNTVGAITGCVVQGPSKEVKVGTKNSLVSRCHT